MYNATIKEFKVTNFGEIYSKIDHSVENSQRLGLQKFAWDGEIQFLQEALIFVQGLELDWTGVIWDADFRDVDSAMWAFTVALMGKNGPAKKLHLNLTKT